MTFADLFEFSIKLTTKLIDLESRRSGRGLDDALAGISAHSMRLAMLRNQQSVMKMQEVIVQYERENDELRLALARLIQLARDSAVIDMDAYREEVERALAERAASAADDSDMPAPPLEDHVMCPVCMSAVPRARTVITAYGILCDQCEFWSSR